MDLVTGIKPLTNLRAQYLKVLTTTQLCRLYRATTSKSLRAEIAAELGRRGVED